MNPDAPNLTPFSLLGDADPAPPMMFTSQPEQAQSIALLYEISHELTSILDREELLRRIAERVKKLVDYHVFSVMLWNESEQMLESVFAQRYDDALPSRFQMPLHQGITGAAAAERRTIRVVDVRLDPRYIACGNDVEVRSELVVPLLLHDRLVGVLDLESLKPHAFSADHERLLNILGSYIAVALENSRLFEDARENQARLMADLDTAREIQRQLLPAAPRKSPAWIWPPPTCPRANWAAISTTFCLTAWAGWRLPMATSPAKVRPQPSMVHSRLASCANWFTTTRPPPPTCCSN